MLSGLVRCNSCENTMVGRKAKNWGKYVLEYTDKKNTAGAKNSGCGIKIKCETLDNYVFNKILEWLEKFKNPNDINIENNEFPSYEKDEDTRLSKLLSEKENARKQFIKSISQGKIIGLSQEEVNEALSDSQKEIQDIKNILINLEKNTEIKVTNQDRIILLRESLKYYIGTNPEDWTFEEKKDLIRYVVREIKVDKENMKIYLL